MHFTPKKLSAIENEATAMSADTGKDNKSYAPGSDSQICNAAYSDDPKVRINAWMRIISIQVRGKDWMNELVPQLHIHSLQPTRPHPAASFLLTIERDHCNNMGTLHGGCTATLFDICTTLPLAFMARPGYWDMLGVGH